MRARLSMIMKNGKKIVWREGEIRGIYIDGDYETIVVRGFAIECRYPFEDIVAMHYSINGEEIFFDDTTNN